MSAAVLSTLTAARALIATPDHWIQGDYEAYDHNGNPTGCFCVIGAVMAVTGELDSFAVEGNPAVLALGGAFESGRPLERHEIENWNDHPTTTHADVLALFDRAIAGVSL